MKKEIKVKLTDLATQIKKDIIRMVGLSGFGPIEMSLSLVELFVFLYWEELLVLPSKPNRDDRDRVFIGMEGAVPALYSVLANRGFLGRDELWHYRRLGSILQALPEPHRVAGIDSPCISNGYSLSCASSAAQILSSTAAQPRVFCVCDISDLSDDFFAEVLRSGEANIGNLILLLIDVRYSDKSEERYNYEDEINIFSKYNWSVGHVKGNSFTDLEKVFSKMDYKNSSPKVMFVACNLMDKLSSIENIKFPQTRETRLKAIALALKELEEKYEK